jgi:hypothetical protein
MSVDGTDLTKITGDSMKVIAEAALAAAAPAVVKQGGWFLSRVAAAVLALVLPLLGGVVGFMTGRATTAPAAVESSAGSGSGSLVVAPISDGSGSGDVPRTVPYDARMILAEKLLGPLNGTGDTAHPAHPADAATAAEADVN